MRETEMKCKAMYLSSLFGDLAHYESWTGNHEELTKIILKELEKFKRLLNKEIAPSKASELMMKVSVSVELKEISTEDLQNELLSRQREIHDIEKEILVLWANGKGLQELAKKYGEFAAVVIEDFKNKNTNKVGINQHFTGVYSFDTMYEMAKKGAKEALMDIKEDERMEDKITEERVRK